MARSRTQQAGPPDAGSEALRGADGEALAEAALRGRVADGELAVALRRPPPAGAPASARYLDELGRRPRCLRASSTTWSSPRRRGTRRLERRALGKLAAAAGVEGDG